MVDRWHAIFRKAENSKKKKNVNENICSIGIYALLKFCVSLHHLANRPTPHHSATLPLALSLIAQQGNTPHRCVSGCVYVWLWRCLFLHAHSRLSTIFFFWFFFCFSINSVVCQGGVLRSSGLFVHLLSSVFILVAALWSTSNVFCFFSDFSRHYLFAVFSLSFHNVNNDS